MSITNVQFKTSPSVVLAGTSNGMYQAANAANGISASKRIATADANYHVVKAGAGRLEGIYAFNASAATKYLKYYNKATAPISTDVPVMTLAIGPGQALNTNISPGIQFAAGIACAITGGSADNDATALVAGDVIVNHMYF